MPSFDFALTERSIIECFPNEVIKWSRKLIPELIDVFPVPSRFMFTVTLVSFVSLFRVVFLDFMKTPSLNSIRPDLMPSEVVLLIPVL